MTYYLVRLLGYFTAISSIILTLTTSSFAMAEEIQGMLVYKISLQSSSAVNV